MTKNNTAAEIARISNGTVVGAFTLIKDSGVRHADGRIMWSRLVINSYNPGRAPKAKPAFGRGSIMRLGGRR